jgi:hypothetical protein
MIKVCPLVLLASSISARNCTRFSYSKRGDNANLSGVDRSDEAFAALEQIGLLYRPDDVVLVYGVPQAANLQENVEFRQTLVDAVRPVVERCRTLLPAETPSIQTL